MLLLLLLAGWSDARIYEPCHFAHDLLAKGAPRAHVATWVCIATHESNLNTSAVGKKNHDGSSDHGIFQISDRYWCSPQGWACNIPCHLLEDDDISDDWKCVRRIFRQHKVLSGNGFNAWSTYSANCKGDNSAYIHGCFRKDGSVGEADSTVASPVASPTSTSSTTEEAEKVEGSFSAREGNNAEKVQVLDLEMMEKKGKSFVNMTISPKRLWKPWTWEI